MIEVAIILMSIGLLAQCYGIRRLQQRVTKLEGGPLEHRLVIDLKNSTGAPIDNVTLNVVHRESWEGDN